jgi:hypothetical protein
LIGRIQYYRLTVVVQKQLVAEESKWKKLTGAVAGIMHRAATIDPVTSLRYE